MTSTASNSHTHANTALDAALAALDKRVVALEARVTALEAAPPPVVVPPPAVVPFLGYASSGPITRTGGAVVIERVTIRAGSVNAPSGIGITVRDATSVTIRDVDLADLVGGIYLYNCSGPLVIERVRSRNIGDGSIGAGHSNHMQLAECRVSGAIRGCKFLGGRTEDMLSTWHTGGIGAGQELVIEDNHLQGLTADTATARAWMSGSGTGIIVSDGSGSAKNGYIIVRRNTLLTPGQVGIQIIDGAGLQVLDNVILGEPYSLNNNPMTTWEGTPSGIATRNRYYYTKGDGTHPDPWQHPGGSGMDFSGNIEDTTLVAATLAVTL